jgi:hypothetical protein
MRKLELERYLLLLLATTVNLLPVESVVVYSIAITALSIELRESEPIECIAF